MVCAAMKMFQFHLKKKDGQTVQSLGTTSLDFIVVLVTGFATLTNLDAVKWLQVLLHSSHLTQAQTYGGVSGV